MLRNPNIIAVDWTPKSSKTPLNNCINRELPLKCHKFLAIFLNKINKLLAFEKYRGIICGVLSSRQFYSSRRVEKHLNSIEDFSFASTLQWRNNSSVVWKKFDFELELKIELEMELESGCCKTVCFALFRQVSSIKQQPLSFDLGSVILKTRDLLLCRRLPFCQCHAATQLSQWIRIDSLAK